MHLELNMSCLTRLFHIGGVLFWCIHRCARSALSGVAVLVRLPIHWTAVHSPAANRWVVGEGLAVWKDQSDLALFQLCLEVVHQALIGTDMHVDRLAPSL